MISQNLQYPKFVPDQLLTSDHLNEMFDYLDEQERLTRTNLIGSGIVCGLEVKPASDGTSIEITRGTGLTSEGYLVTLNNTIYNDYIPFNPEKKEHYFPFLTGSKRKKFDLWELKQNASVEESTPLSLSFLNGNGVDSRSKIVILFVELFRRENKNCNPESCDDKGRTIEVNVRPLLVNKRDVDAFNLKAGIDGALYNKNFLNLDQMLMPRFDVTNTGVSGSSDIFNAYIRILNNKFLSQVESMLTATWNIFLPAVGADYNNVNPFNNFAEKFSWIHDGSMKRSQFIKVQYYYDLVSDILAAYDEFRECGLEILGMCCPDSSLFPRHLLLDNAIPDVSQPLSEYRHYFHYSHLFHRKDLHDKLKMLFRRIVLMMSNFMTGSTDDPIRITPSRLDDSPLSKKAIPYYYSAELPAQDPLLYNWSYERRMSGESDRILSYHAVEYTRVDYVKSPLKYDIEKYNFFRIEGHIGKKYTNVLKNLKEQISNYRIPVDVIVLQAGEDPDLEFSHLPNSVIYDLELNYDIARREWEANIGQTIEYFNLIMEQAAVYVNRPSRTNHKRLENYVCKLLQSSKHYMVDSMVEFAMHYWEFMKLYESIEIESEEIRADLMKILDNAKTDQSFIEDLVDHFDNVDLSYKKGVFRALYQDYMRRVKESWVNKYLTAFLKKHPGIQHKSGVPVGGTFIVVYHDTDTKVTKRKLSEKRVKGDFNLMGIVTSPDGRPLVDATVSEKDSTNNVTTDKNGMFRLRVNSLPAVLVTNHEEYSREEMHFTEDNLSSRITMKEPHHMEQDILQQIGKGTVIADFFLPYRVSSDGASISFTIEERPNKLPVANAGDNLSIQLPVKSVNLSGSGSDTDGQIIQYSWECTDGPAECTINKPENADTEVIFNADGIYTFTLTVTDDNGAKAKDTVVVTVLKANEPPVAEAGDEITIRYPDVKRVTLRGSATDPDGNNTIVKYNWEKTSGSNVCKIVSPEQAITDVSFTDRGNFTFRLTVTDNKGATSQDQVHIIVVRSPEVNAGVDISFDQPRNQVMLNGSVNDPDNLVVKYEWVKFSGPENYSIDKKNALSTNVSVNSIGTYAFQLIATDKDGVNFKDSVVVTVLKANEPPVANAGQDLMITEQKSVRLDGRSSRDPDGKINSYLWIQESGPEKVRLLPSENISNPLTSTILTPGEYIFKLTVTDNKGAQSSDKVILRVNPRPVALATPVKSVVEQTWTQTLDGSKSYAHNGAKIVAHLWQQIGGPRTVKILKGNTAKPTVGPFEVIGDYLFRLTVIDSLDGNSAGSCTVTVTYPTIR